MADIDATVDVYCIDDFLPHMPAVTGRTALVHRLARRLSTERGRFPFWPDFGTDITKFLLSKADPARIAQEAEDECMKDEQVRSVEVTVTAVDFGRSITLTIAVVDADGPFVFTLSISEARTKLISLQEAA